MKPKLHPTTLGLAPSFGYGDRLGLATPGHLAAHRQHAGPIEPIFAQQSIREMARTHRSARQVMRAAIKTLAHEDFTGKWGADADHLKNENDVAVMAHAGFTFYTIDPSDHVDGQADEYNEATLAARFDDVKPRIAWLDEYLNQTVKIDGGPTIAFDEPTVRRAAVKYGQAIDRSLKLASFIADAAENERTEFEIELSVDETPHPTTPAEHYIIADQMRRAGVKLVSLAPRFVGAFEKGVDYRGDVAAFERSLADHAAIARQLGPYKLSLHSGSDKLSIYPALARITGGRFHVKTAGTSYLEALRVVAVHDAELFRRIIELARTRFEADRATYHVSASLDRVAPPADMSDDDELVRLYLDGDDGRQILHVTFGSVLCDALFRPAVLDVLKAHRDTHRRFVAEHLGRHLQALRQGMDP